VRARHQCARARWLRVRARAFPMSQVGSRSIWFARAKEAFVRWNFSSSSNRRVCVLLPTPVKFRLSKNMSWDLRWNAVARRLRRCWLLMILLFFLFVDDDMLWWWMEGVVKKHMLRETCGGDASKWLFYDQLVLVFSLIIFLTVVGAHPDCSWVFQLNKLKGN